MSDASPVARSPIAPAPPEVVRAGWAVSGRRSAATLSITDWTPVAKVAVKADPESLAAQSFGVAFGRASKQTWTLDGRDVPVIVAGSGPGEWLLLAPPGTQRSLASRLGAAIQTGAGELVSVVDLTHGRALVRLTGAGSADVLAKETAVDITDEMCPDGAAFRSALAGLAADVIRDDRDGTRAYLISCERSSGQYLFDSLLDAGAEFGIEVDGFVPPGI